MRWLSGNIFNHIARLLKDVLIQAAQRCIWDPVKHLQWSLITKIYNRACGFFAKMHETKSSYRVIEDHDTLKFNLKLIKNYGPRMLAQDWPFKCQKNSSICSCLLLADLNLFHTNGLFLYLLKTENLGFFGIFGGYGKRPVAWNGFTKVKRHFDKKVIWRCYRERNCLEKTVALWKLVFSSNYFNEL